MSGDVQQVSPPGPEEAWERLTDDPDVRGIETVRVEEIGGWQVTVCAMEFARDGSLETDMRERLEDRHGHSQHAPTAARASTPTAAVPGACAG